MVNKYTKKYKKIIDELIDKSFVELKGKWIVVSGVNFQISTAYMSITYLFFMVGIVVFPLGHKCNKTEIKSILAHELSHYAIILNMKFFEKLKFAFRWLFTKKGKAWFEGAADKFAIQKGYAHGLYSRVLKIEKQKNNQKLKNRMKQGYLSSKQIKSYAKKIGKW